MWDSGERVVGFVSLMGNEIGALFVAPAFHGQGIGRALVDHARELRGEMEVEVFQANAIGRSFYDRYGFEFCEEKRHEATGQTLLRLRLPVGE